MDGDSRVGLIHRKVLIDIPRLLLIIIVLRKGALLRLSVLSFFVESLFLLLFDISI